MKLAVFQDCIGFSSMGNDRAIYREPIGWLGYIEPRNGDNWLDNLYILNENSDGFIKISKEFVEREFEKENRYKVEDWSNGESYYFKIYLNDKLIYEEGDIETIGSDFCEVEESNTISVFKGSYVYDILRAISKIN